MAFRKKTLRTMSPTARKVARLIGELESVSKRLKNLVPEIQKLDLDSQALITANQPKLKLEPTDHHYFVLLNKPYVTYSIHEFWPFGKIRSPFNSIDEAVARERLIADQEGFLDTLYLANSEELTNLS